MLTNTILVLLLTCSAQMVHKERGDKMDATIFVAFNSMKGEKEGCQLNSY